MVPKAIPKVLVKELQFEMINMNYVRFNHFKSYIRTKARKELNYGGITKQDPVRWENFKMQVIREFPELLEYEEQWPIEAYFRQFASFENNKKRKTSRAATSMYATPPKRRITFFAGDTPRHRPRCITRLATDSEIRALQRPSRPLSVRSLNISQTASATDVINDRMDQPCTYTSQVNNANLSYYPVPCVKCGAIPKSAPSFNKEVINFLSGSNALISVLSSLGIISDHHLIVYRQWGSTNFLDSVRDNIIDPLHRAALEKCLNDVSVTKKMISANDETIASSKFKTISFPQPSAEHETRIIQATSSEELRKAMGLEDDVAHYILLTKYIDDAIKGMDTQLEQDEWSSIVNKICDNCPELNDFQNTWPISFYVKWKHARICSARLQKIMSRDLDICSPTNGMTDAENFVDPAPGNLPVRSIWKHSQHSTQSNQTFQPELSQSKETPWSDCLIHPLPKAFDVSAKMLAHLRNFGMEELLPVFLFADIKTDDDFDLFSSLDEEQRNTVFDSLEETFNLKPFQKMMLDLLIQEAGTLKF